MITGTNHFISFASAVSYYFGYGFDSSDVSEKIQNGEIKIGPPQIKDGQKLLINKDEGRYFVQD